MSEWNNNKLSYLVDIRVSNVDKKIHLNKKKIKLCNYMDAYSNDYITSNIRYSEGSADLNELNRFRLILNDVIITKDSETPEDIAVSSVVTEEIENLVCGYHLAILRPRENRINGPFLMHKLKLPQVQKYFFRIASGSTRYGLTIGGIENTELSHPPLPHQRKIARILTTVDNIIEKTESAIEKYKAIKQGMMHDLFTRGIDVKTGKLRPLYEDAPELYKETELGVVPKDWEVGTLDMIAFVNPSSKPHNLSNYDLVSFIPMECVSNDATLVSTYKKKVGEVLQGFTHFRDGDILFAKITPCMENGKGALVNGLKNGFGYGSTEFHVLRPIKQQSTLFVYYLTTSSMFRLKAEGKMTGSAGQQRVPIDFVTKYRIGIPLLKEQEIIGNRLNTASIKIKCEQKYLSKNQKLKQALMQDLLTGKKEVTPDPEDFDNEQLKMNSEQ